jgi:hypothetical protein
MELRRTLTLGFMDLLNRTFNIQRTHVRHPYRT